MKFGAHEVLEASEILTEKMNLINHLAFYEQEAQDDRLRSMIRNHMESAIAAYDTMVAYTHDYSASRGMPSPYSQPSASVERIKYGLRNPQPMMPMRTGHFDDSAIQRALLSCHKASAACHLQRGLEVSDPNLRQMFLNGAITCYNQAYEVFLFMNEQGTYQVPSMDNHTAKTQLHAFQPMHQQPYQEMQSMQAMQAMPQNRTTSYQPSMPYQPTSGQGMQRQMQDNSQVNGMMHQSAYLNQ
jgi:spore coat protein CotF